MTTRRMPIPFMCLLVTALVTFALIGCASDPAAYDFSNMTTGERIEQAHRLASLAQSETDPVEAQQLYLAAVDAYPAFAASWNNLGVLLMNDDRLLEAHEAFTVAARLDQRDPRPNFNKGLMFQRRGQLLEAKRAYEDALLRDPKYLPALMGHIECEVRSGDAGLGTLERIEQALLLHNDADAIQQLRLQQLRISNENRPSPNGTNPSQG